MIFDKLEKELKPIIKTKPKIVLGFSGGPDSVFLFHFLKKLHEEKKVRLLAVHLNHEWRSESILDENFCIQMCKEHNIKLTVAKAKKLGLNLKFNGSKEEIGRKMRHHLFKKVLAESRADFISLAHHLQDQQETFLWRIIRGTTLSGLTCMKKVDYPYLRPLLETKREDIINYLDTNNIKYIKDPSNESDEYLRNRIRKYVIPNLKKCDSRFDQKFASSLRHLQQEEDFLQNLAKKSFDITFKIRSEKFIGNLESLKNLDPVLLNRVLILWLSKEKVSFTPSKNYLNEITKFIFGVHGGSHQISKTWKLCKKKNLFWIEKS